MADSIKFDYNVVNSTLNKLQDANDSLNTSFINNQKVFERICRVV